MQGDRVTAAEEFANYPGNVASPQTKGKNRDTAYGLDENPYGGYVADHDRYREYGGQRQDSYTGSAAAAAGNPNLVVWQGPTEEALRAHATREIYQSEVGHGHNYEYEQQKQMDTDSAAWRDTQPHDQRTPNGVGETMNGDGQVPLSNPHAGGAPWGPLSINRGQTPVTDDVNGAANGHVRHMSTPPVTDQQQQQHQLEPPLELSDPGRTQMDGTGTPPISAGTMIDLPPPNPAFLNDNRARTPQDGFYTPMTDMGGFDPIDQLEQLEKMEKDYTINESESAAQVPVASSSSTADAPPPPPPPPPPAPIPVPTGRDSPGPMSPSSPATYGTARGGKISAAAFRRGAKPRMSGDDEDSKTTRRLPVPPISSAAAEGSSVGMTAASTIPPVAEYDAGMGTDGHTEEGHGAYSDAKRESDPPPLYANESLR